MSAPIIQTTSLSRRFGDFTAVDQLSITVERGTIFAFLGANGSGKSTTIRMLIGVLQPTNGAIVVDGVDVIAHPRRVRDRIGYMGQKVSLYQGLSILENVEFYAGLYGLHGRDLTTRWGELRESLGLRSAEHERPENLSAGIRQRAGLALATLHRPPILFLDEPTAGVDLESRGLFWDRIRDEADRGVTIFVTTLFLEEVENCDWASFIEAGRLVANAEPEALRRQYSPGYRVRVEGSSAARETAARILGDTDAALSRQEDGLEALVPSLETTTLALLERLRLEAGATITIAQPAMTDVFRRILSEVATP
jgi:ABC-2 type transport system ATP-binding protein